MDLVDQKNCEKTFDIDAVFDIKMIIILRKTQSVLIRITNGYDGILPSTFSESLIVV